MLYSFSYFLLLLITCFFNQNRMLEALTLFDSICSSWWFVKISIVRPYFSCFLFHTDAHLLDPVLEQD